MESVIAVVVSTVLLELTGPPLTKLTLWWVGAVELSGKHPMAGEGG